MSSTGLSCLDLHSVGLLESALKHPPSALTDLQIDLTLKEDLCQIPKDVEKTSEDIEPIKKEKELNQSEKDSDSHHIQKNTQRNDHPKKDEVALSSQTDLSKMSSTGLKTYHTMSTKKTPNQSLKTQTSLIEESIPMNSQLIFISAEVSPWSKTGGLGDVAGTLPLALADRGHRVMVVTPKYMNGQTDHLYDNTKDSGCSVVLDLGHGGQQSIKYYTYRKGDVDFVFVDHPCFHRQGTPYGDDYGTFKDNSFRYAILSMAACEAPLVLELTTSISWSETKYGEEVVFLANDWHTALVPVYLTAKYRPHGVFESASCILAIHNLAHQGIESPAMFHNLGIPESHYGIMEWVANDGFISMNILKGGLVTADRIITVSCMHAFDMLTTQGSMGLHPIIQCRQNVMNGIINGIDYNEWNPETDIYIAQQYSTQDLTGKEKCKLSLQRELEFRTSLKIPLIGYVGRLDYQKGPDLVLEALPWMISNRCQLVMLGTGDPIIEAEMKEAEQRYKGSFSAQVRFSVPLSHRIIAGCDFILVPSRFEPCGLTQQFAIRYGTIPIAHATGGLMDTIEDFCPFGETMGTGFLFRKPDAEHLIRAVDRAIETFRTNPEGWKTLQNGMTQDFTWSRPATAYETVIKTCIQQTK
eukprot:g3269.t1